MLQFPRSRFSPRRLTTSHRACSQHFRSVLALGLAALLFLAPLSFRVSAQETGDSSKQTQAQTHQFTLYQDEEGNVVCRAATLAERREMENVKPSEQGLHQINHLKFDDNAHSANIQSGANAGTGLTIILRATTQLQGNTAANA